MADPAANLILTEVGARFANITVANGYYYTVKKISEGRLTPFKGFDLPAINYWCTTLLNERTEYNDDKRSLELFVEIFSLTRDDPFTRVVGKLAADVITGLTRATGAPKVSDDENYDLGETVSDFILENYDYLIGQGQEPWCGALIKFTIKYQTDPFDMFSHRV